MDNVFPEMERIKISLKTREIPNPVARSQNRPTDVVRLTTSNLPQINWAAGGVAAGGVAGTEIQVDELLDFLSPSPAPGGGTSQPIQPVQAAAAASNLPEYQPKYLSSGRDGQDKHALFYSSAADQRNTGSGRPSTLPGSMTPSTSNAIGSSGGASIPIPRYPLLNDARLPPPSLLDEVQLQRLQLGPSAGPTLGPQEVGVRMQCSE